VVCVGAALCVSNRDCSGFRRGVMVRRALLTRCRARAGTSTSSLNTLMLLPLPRSRRICLAPDCLHLQTQYRQMDRELFPKCVRCLFPY